MPILLTILLVLQFILPIAISSSIVTNYLSAYPSECDSNLAAQCQYEFLLCKLFNGPANDATTLCDCATIYYGSCLRQAGCLTSYETGTTTIYMSSCISFIIEYNCADALICAINCASETYVDRSTSKIIPFNNYGAYYLRVRICLYKIQEQRLQRYSVIQQVTCSSISDFQVCNRFIPPSSFVPVALPINTTYIEIDSCISLTNGSYQCLSSPPPVQVYGNTYLFPTSYEVSPTNGTSSICTSDSDCLGSFCDTLTYPNICSRKTIQQALGSGANYLSL